MAMFASMASAAEKPPELSGIIHATTPYGAGSMKWLFITAYDANLWTDSARWSMRAPFALTLRYHMSFSTDDLVSRTIKEMHRIDPALDDAQLARYRAMLSRVLPDVKSGDEITALYRPDEPVRFYLNGNLTGQSGSVAFAKPFFDIWLSPKTSEPDLREELLQRRA